MLLPSTLAVAPLARASHDDDNLLVEFSLPAPSLRFTDRGEVATLEGAELRAAAPGHPRLPVVSLTVVLPPGMHATSVQVEGSAKLLSGRHHISWGQPLLPIGMPTQALIPADATIYTSNEAYPAQPAQLSGGGVFRGFHLATVEFWPLQLRPASGTLLWRADAKLRIQLESGPADDEAGTLAPRGLPDDLRALATIAINPELARNYPTAKGGKASEPYMIICPQSLKASFQPLLDHRTAQGMPGRILTTEWILDHYSGVDNAEKVREAIREAYTERGTSFVLLGGDDVDDSGALLVPYRGCLLNAGGYRYVDAPVDYYFGALDGNWNTNGNNIWCEANEIDYYSEVHIGRATVDTPAEVKHFVDKLLRYEAGLPRTRQRDLVWMGESLDANTWGGDSKDVTAGLIPADDYDLTRLYAREGSFSRNAVIDNLNRGPHLTNHLGHANRGFVMGINRSDVDSLTNEFPFFSYSQGCDSGGWDQSFSGNSEAVSEHFLSAEHGAFGVVMNARYGWYESGSTEGPSQFLDHEFYDALFREGLLTLGEANDDSRADNAPVAQTDETRRWCFLETNLHGDPATPVQVGPKLRIAARRVIEDDPLHGNANGTADPKETVRIAITLENTDEDPATAVEAFLTPLTRGVTVHDRWAAWETIPGHAQAENLAPHFSATLDLPCGSYGSFSLEIFFDNGKHTTTKFSILAGQREDGLLFQDDFESDKGWEVSGGCSDGNWVRDVPRGTTHQGKPANPSEDATPDPGARAYVTGNEGVAADDDDVDGGRAVLTSPLLDASGWLELDLSLMRWFYLAPMTVPAINTLKIEISDDAGQSWKLLEQLSAPENR